MKIVFHTSVGIYTSISSHDIAMTENDMTEFIQHFSEILNEKILFSFTDEHGNIIILPAAILRTTVVHVLKD